MKEKDLITTIMLNLIGDIEYLYYFFHEPYVCCYSPKPSTLHHTSDRCIYKVYIYFNFILIP